MSVKSPADIGKEKKKKDDTIYTSLYIDSEKKMIAEQIYDNNYRNDVYIASSIYII